MESDFAQRIERLWMSLLMIVASSSAFLRPCSPPPNGSSIEADWSSRNRKHPGFRRLISAVYGMPSPFELSAELDVLRLHSHLVAARVLHDEDLSPARAHLDH